MQEINDLIRELRFQHLCITHDEDCSSCAEEKPWECRRNQKLFKEAADMLTRYSNTGLTPQEVCDLKFRMEGLEK